MNVPVSDAKAQLTDLVRRAEAGEDVVLTRRGKPAVRLVPVARTVDMERRRRGLDALWKHLQTLPPSPGPCAARSADFLYDDEGLPA